MGRYGLILGPIEAYTQNIAIGTIVDPIPAHSKSTKINRNKPNNNKQNAARSRTESEAASRSLVCRAARGPATLKGSYERRECRTGFMVTAALDLIS